jgi:hypothetical protein
MRTSASIAELADALCKAQGKMGGATKDSTNPFFKSKYADLGSVIKAIKEPFYAAGLSYVQFPVSSEEGIGVLTRLMHCSGEWLEQEYYVPLAKRDAQGAGSCITYARRYALQSIAGIPSEDDDGQAASVKPDYTMRDLEDQKDKMNVMINSGERTTSAIISNLKSTYEVGSGMAQLITDMGSRADKTPQNKEK